MFGIPSAPHGHPGARQAAVAAPRAIPVAWCNAHVITRLTCGGYALLFVIAGSLRIGLFQQIHGRGRSGPVRAGLRARLLALRVLLALSAGPTGATHPPCRPSGWSQPGQERPLRPARAYFWPWEGATWLLVVEHRNVVNNHLLLDDV